MNNHPFEPGALVAVYARDSGGDEQELSVDQQLRVINEWAQINNIRIGKVFSDSSSGTTTAGRDQFLRMIGYFQHGPPEVGIVVWRSNRFGRNIDDVQFFRSDLRRRGFVVHSITDNIPDGPMGRLIEFALDWKDEIFSAQLSEDVKRGLADLVRQHGAVPGVPPRGFKREPITIGTRRNGQAHIVHRWIPDPEMIPVIQRAYEMRARGATMRSIQADTKLYTSVNGWCTFFSNKIYKGVLEFSDMTIDNYCTPIVNADLWQAANLVGQQRRFTPKGQTKRLVSSYLLSGLARCQKCGALMVGHSIYTSRYYACSRRQTHYDCDARLIPAERLDTEVVSGLVNHVLSLDNMMLIQARMAEQYTLAMEDVSAQRDEYTRRLAAANRSINNLLADITQNGPSEAIGKMLRQKEVERTEASLKLSVLQKQLLPPEMLTTASMSEIAQQIVDIIQNSETEQKRYYMKGFIQHISARRDEDAIRGCISYYPPFAV
jgi:DNA invertase Pin-like site-specific DNA recombinase